MLGVQNCGTYTYTYIIYSQGPIFIIWPLKLLYLYYPKMAAYLYMDTQSISVTFTNRNVTHHCHFTLVYSFGNNQTTVDTGTARELSIYIFWQEMLGTFLFTTADGMLPNKNTIHIDSIICFNVQGVQHYSSGCLY